MIIGHFINRGFSSRKMPYNFNKAHSGYDPNNCKAFTIKYLLILSDTTIIKKEKSSRLLIIDPGQEAYLTFMMILWC